MHIFVVHTRVSYELTRDVVQLQKCTLWTDQLIFNFFQEFATNFPECHDVFRFGFHPKLVELTEQIACEDDEGVVVVMCVVWVTESVRKRE